MAVKLEFMTIKIAIKSDGTTFKNAAHVVDSCNEHLRSLRDEDIIVDWCYDPECLDGRVVVEAPEPYEEDSAWYLEGQHKA